MNFVALKEEILSNCEKGSDDFSNWVIAKKSLLKNKLKDNMVIELGSLKKTNISRIDKKSRIRLFQRICLFSYKREEIEAFFDCLRVLDASEILEECLQTNCNFIRKEEQPALSKVDSLENIDKILPEYSGIIKFFCKREVKSEFRILKHARDNSDLVKEGVNSGSASNNSASNKFVQRILVNFFICVIERKSSSYKEIMAMLSDFINITNH